MQNKWLMARIRMNRWYWLTKDWLEDYKEAVRRPPRYDPRKPPLNLYDKCISALKAVAVCYVIFAALYVVGHLLLK